MEIKRMNRQRLKHHRCLMAAIGIVFLVFLPFILFNDHLFIFAGDSFEQQVKMYIQAWCRLKEGSLPFWDWSNFLGNNYFGASTFYFLGSPFFWLAMLVPAKEWIPYTFLSLNILKSLCCVFFSYLWLYKATHSDLGAACGALIVTFSGFVLINYTNNHMLDAVLFMPLVLYFTESFLKGKRWFGLSLSLGMLGIVSYYFLYLFLPFLCLYALIRYCVLQTRIQLSAMLKKGTLFLMAVFLGIGISALTLLPSFYALQGNPRSADFAFGLNTIGKTNLFRFLTSFLNPVNDWRQNANFFVSTAVDEGIGWCGGMTNYSLILSAFLIIPLMGIKKSREKIGILVLYGIYGIFAIFPMFYVLFNQNYESRWMLVFPLMNAFMAAFVIAKRAQISRRWFILAAAGVILALSGSFLLSWKMQWVYEFWEIDILKRNVLVLSCFVLLYSFLFIFRQKLTERGFRFGVITLVLCEVAFSFYNCFYNLDETNHPMDQETLDSLHLFDDEVIASIKEKDSGFYRIDIATLNPLSYNDALAKRYLSFNGYHSVYNYRQSDFILGRFNTQNSWIFYSQKGKTLLKTLLGSKYWFSYGGITADYRNELSYGYTDLPPYGYTYWQTIDGIDIYENQYPLSFAYGVKKTIAKETFLAQSQLQQDLLLLDHVVLEKNGENSAETLSTMQRLSPLEENQDRFALTDWQNGMLILEFDRNRYRYYCFLDDQEKILAEGMLTHEMGYTMIKIPENAAFFELDSAKDFDIYADSMDWFEDWYAELHASSAKEVQFDDNSISGTIILEEAGWITTSVPYDEGWTVTVNGKRIQTEKVNLGFIGFWSEAGTIRIEMSYFPPGLKLGLMISIFCLGIVLIVNFSKKVQKDSDEFKN